MTDHEKLINIALGLMDAPKGANIVVAVASLLAKVEQLEAAAKAEPAEPEPFAWTGKGCGVITDKHRRRMIEQGSFGGEFAIAAGTAQRHDEPLYRGSDLRVLWTAFVMSQAELAEQAAQPGHQHIKGPHAFGEYYYCSKDGCISQIHELQFGSAQPEAADAAYLDVRAERKRQALQWCDDIGGTPEDHDDEHTYGEWVSYIDHQANLMNPTNQRERFVKIAALAVAAIESIDRIADEERKEAGA